MAALRSLVLLLLLLLAASACGGDGEPSEATPVATADDPANSEQNDSDDAGAANVADQQAPGQAVASVDGLSFTLTEPGALDCTITDDAITFSFRIGDNEVTLGAGANRYDEWLGNVNLRVADPDGEAGPIAYFPDLAANSDAIAISGNSFSYSGPMMKQPSNDGSNPPPVDVGDGTISVTCP